MLGGTTSTPFAPHAPHLRSHLVQQQKLRALPVLWDSPVHLRWAPLEMREQLHPSVWLCSPLRCQGFPISTRAPHKEPGCLIPNFLFPFTEP